MEVKAMEMYEDLPQSRSGYLKAYCLDFHPYLICFKLPITYVGVHGSNAVMSSNEMPFLL
jgi:hypothetical protein